MKFIKTITLLSGAVLTLSSCSGVNLGKEVTKSEFETEIAKVNPEKAFEKVESVKIKMDYTYDGNFPGVSKLEYHVDFSLNESTDVEKLPVSEQYACFVVSEITYKYIQKLWSEVPTAYKTYIGENPTTYGIQGEFKVSVSNIALSAKGTYQWNQYLGIKYVDEVKEEKEGDYWCKESTYLNVDYTYKQ